MEAAGAFSWVVQLPSAALSRLLALEAFTQGGSGLSSVGEKMRLCSSLIEARDKWVDRLKMAARPTWISDDDPVRDPATWTILQHDGPNHLGLWCDVLPEHQMALITSFCVPFSGPASAWSLGRTSVSSTGSTTAGGAEGPTSGTR